MTIGRLHHVTITIPKGMEPEGRAFYCGVLGLTEIEKPESLLDQGGFWLDLGAVQVHITTENGYDPLKTKGHIAYQVEDLEAWRAKIIAEGLNPVDNTLFPGYRRFDFRDPFGNRIELIEPE
jgi:catechol 2,3-dioxygenase-like lactoylglutathione lyase family enzyme